MTSPLVPDDKLFSRLKNIERICVVSLHCVGDALLSTPVMRILKDHFPNARLTVIAGPAPSPLLAAQPFIDEVVVLNTRDPQYKGAAGMLRLAKSLRRESYDLAVDLRQSGIPFAMRVRHRVFSFAVKRSGKLDGIRHALDHHLAVLEAYGFPITRREMRLDIPAAAREAALRAIGPMPEGAVPIAVAPGAGSAYKIYPFEKAAAALEIIAARSKAHFIFIGSPAEAPFAETVGARVPGRWVNLAGKASLVEIAAAVSSCKLLIANDSGPMHIGAALGVPTLALFGPTDPERYGPRGPLHRVLRATQPCAPCKSPTCGHDSCIADIPESDIATAALETLQIK